jgi:hypothetical protein
MQHVELTQAIVQELLDYYPDTGDLIWRYRDRKWFQTAQDQKMWNTRYAGKPAGRINHQGYVVTVILSKEYQAHRVIHLGMTGEWPDEIDHQEHVRDDNRWIILANTDAVGNARNHTLQQNNKSGCPGVYEYENGWRSRISHSRNFSTYEEAAAALETMQREFGFIQRTNTNISTDIVKSNKAWKARVTYSRSFPTYEEAVAAREVRERNSGYHQNHGAPKEITYD